MGSWKLFELVVIPINMQNWGKQSFLVITTKILMKSFQRTEILKNRFNTIPVRVKIPRNFDVLDTPENRFAKHALKTCEDFLFGIENSLEILAKKSDAAVYNEASRLRKEITDILGEGKCPRGHQIGEVFNYPEDIGKIFPTAFHTLFPAIRVMQSGGSFPWFEEPDSHSNCCPDYKRPVVFKISRKEV